MFEADLRAGELRRNGVRVRLQDLPFRALTLLLTRPGEVITREEFRQALWPSDIFVDFEQGISSAVMRLRDALRDSADNPIFIETIERRGYRWIGPIKRVETVPGSNRRKAWRRKRKQPQRRLRRGPRRGGRWSLPWLCWRCFSPCGFSVPAVAAPKRACGPVPRAHRPFIMPPIARPKTSTSKGRFYWNQRTPESLNQALDAFTQAIARDPNYSDAYVGLADCYNLLREFSAMPGNEAYFKAFAAAKKAVELDQQSSDAHASLAFVTFFGMWDAADAEKEFRRAIELDPNNCQSPPLVCDISAQPQSPRGSPDRD